MGRGLSSEQRAILGLACAVNRTTQGGVLAAKPSKPVSLRLAVWAIGGFEPSRRIKSTRIFFENSLLRALARLTKRGLLAYVPSWHWSIGLDYVLTEAGYRGGRALREKACMVVLGFAGLPHGIA
jgi:hypothetical protein